MKNSTQLFLAIVTMIVLAVYAFINLNERLVQVEYMVGSPGTPTVIARDPCFGKLGQRNARSKTPPAQDCSK
jgi:amino acid permease